MINKKKKLEKTKKKLEKAKQKLIKMHNENIVCKFKIKVDENEKLPKL